MIILIGNLYNKRKAWKTLLKQTISKLCTYYNFKCFESIFFVSFDWKLLKSTVDFVNKKQFL